MASRVLIFAALVAPVVWATPAASGDSHADWIWEQLRQERRLEGLPELERRADLDEVARNRARKIAALEHGKRLAFGETLQVELREAGVRRYVRAVQHLDLSRGYVYPARAFLRGWKKYEPSWVGAMDPAFDSVGLATAPATDGWIIFVAVLLEEWALSDLRALETEALAAINEIRRGHRLGELVEVEALTEVARSHSRDMAARGFFDHMSPEGLRPADRLGSVGLVFGALAENIQMSNGSRDPVADAVASWMNSPSHRAAILAPDYSQTGLGVAQDAERGVYFTQLFLQP